MLTDTNHSCHCIYMLSNTTVKFSQEDTPTHKKLFITASTIRQTLSLSFPLHLAPTYLFLSRPRLSMAVVVTMETERLWKDGAAWMPVCGWVAWWDSFTVQRATW